MAMISHLEIQPDHYTIVVGPKFSAEVVKDLLDNGSSARVKLPASEFKCIVDRGVSHLLKRETFASDADKAKFEARYNNAYELDPVFVLRKILSSLQTAGCYEEWLEELFACNVPAQQTCRSLQHLLTLQSKGALLVYVHCDDIIARAAGLEPVLLENEEQIERWAKGEGPAGILQPHGVYSRPDTVQLDCSIYDDATHPLKATIGRLKHLLSSRSTILLGDDWDQLPTDPLLTHFCNHFVRESTQLVINTARDSADLPGLPLCTSSPFPMVIPITRSSADLWKQINRAPMLSSHHRVVCLLVSSQAGAQDMSHMMFNAPGVNFVLVNPVMHDKASTSCVSLRVLSGKLNQLWRWLLVSSRDALLSRGLIGLALHGGTFLWLRDPSTNTHGGGGDVHCNNTVDVDRRNANSIETLPNSSDIQNESSLPSPSIQPSGSEVRAQNKIIQRYKVVKKRIGHRDLGPHGGHFMSKAGEETGMMLSHHYHTPYTSKYARRGSLPPIKCGEAGNALTVLAERLQTAAGDDGPSSSLPSYVAIKRALLSDKFKHVQGPLSRLAVPKVLLNLLQAKKHSVDINEKSRLLAHRRNSDPGSYLQDRDKARRRQLFLDENLQWIKTHSPIIERKIQSWRQKRLLRMQREYFYAQQEKLSACHQPDELHLMNTGKLVPSPLYNSLTSTTPHSLTTLPQAFVAAAGSGLNGLSPAPLVYQLPSTGLTPTSVLVPAPFISPYTFMGSYATIPVTAAAQPTATYIMPPTALTQQRMMFLPSASSASPTVTTNASDIVPDTKPPFSSLLAPTSLPETEDTTPCVASSVGSRKRKTAFPEKLSSLLQPPSDPYPVSPPNGKRFRPEQAAYNDMGHMHSSPPLSPTYMSSHDHQSHHSSNYHKRHHRHHHSSSHHHHSHHSSSSYSHCHQARPHPSSPHPHHPHSQKSPSPLQQCLLQPPGSPNSDGRAVDNPGGSPSSLSSPPADFSSHTPPQLWQFLLELLLTADCSKIIQWTNSAQECEFTIHEPVQVAQLWGKCTNNSAMNYDKLARGLRYYYSKGIIEKVEGKKFTFRYNGLARSYVQQRFRQTEDVTSSMDELVVVE